MHHIALSITKAPSTRQVPGCSSEPQRQEGTTTAMDYFYRTLETAQERARQAATAASTSAQTLAQQVQTHTASLSEQASERIKSLHLQEAVQKHVDAFQQQRNSEKAGPSQEQLEAYAITPDFQAFVRSLTYSTFRDFPQQDQQPEHSADSASESSLSPQQAQSSKESDLDTYLQDALGRDHVEGPEGEDSHSRDISSAGGDDDFDQYLRELNAGEAKHEDDTTHAKGSDDECSTPDLDDYVKDLQSD
ncbi:hypothetical protein WJX73_003915 [Symbiochloris irregularis]|uniref:Uncharacterized protein n=1 Tax=Symbiochloris irregularis TaxID=706552 RepID=A0AAW1NNC6_9CHLO